ncbi:MAG: GGDEF domain-containing protein [Phycisphaerae bacterium]
MVLSLVLPWFPIVLAVGVGGRLLDRTQGLGFGILGACFWALLAHVAVGPMLFLNWATCAAVLAGAIAIVTVGAWAGSVSAVARNHPPSNSGPWSQPGSSAGGVSASVASALDRFEDWLQTYRESVDPWPDFGELLRVLLHDLCGATHVYPYRVERDASELVPLRAVNPGEPPKTLPAGEGIIGHVLTTGRSYVAGEAIPAEAADHSDTPAEPIAWCFAIRNGSQNIGLIKAGYLVGLSELDPKRLEMAEALVGRFWTTLEAVCRRQRAETRDSASGLLARQPFMRQARQHLAAAYGRSDPVAVAVIGLEGVRAMGDRGDWELADDLVREVADLLAGHVRADDLIGRLDDSRFVLLLRRVNSALGELIVGQLRGKVKTLCDDATRWKGPIAVRCGLSTCRAESPPLTELVRVAVEQCHRARETHSAMCSDLPDRTEASAPKEVAPGVQA